MLRSCKATRPASSARRIRERSRLFERASLRGQLRLERPGSTSRPGCATSGGWQLNGIYQAQPASPHSNAGGCSPFVHDIASRRDLLPHEGPQTTRSISTLVLTALTLRKTRAPEMTVVLRARPGPATDLRCSRTRLRGHLRTGAHRGFQHRTRPDSPANGVSEPAWGRSRGRGRPHRAARHQVHLLSGT